MPPEGKPLSSGYAGKGSLRGLGGEKEKGEDLWGGDRHEAAPAHDPHDDLRHGHHHGARSAELLCGLSSGRISGLSSGTIKRKEFESGRYKDPAYRKEKKHDK